MNSPIKTSTARAHWIYICALVVLTLLVSLPGLSNMPVIDRDEARYAQASVQMAESDDYVNIHFQDTARNKKPAGTYWLQAGMIKAVSEPGERHLWAQRLPSVLGALLAIIATYWGGARMIGRRGAAIGAGLLAVSFVLVFEAHIAKTDAILCGLSALTLGTLAHLRHGGGRRSSLLFWAALGMSIMIKGPLLPAIVGLTLITLMIWERGRNGWLRNLLFWPGPLLMLAIVLPWVILIWQATDGQFFRDALVGDFGSKLGSAQEKHGAPPGTYLATIWVFFWPASLFLLAGLAFVIRAAKHGAASDAPVVKAARLLIAWVIPMWIILEIVPTKLPHYPLPLYPALALMCGAAVLTLMHVQEFKVTRTLNALIFAGVTIALGVGVLVAESLYGPESLWIYAPIFASLLAGLVSAFCAITRRIRPALAALYASALLLYIPTYQFILPTLETLRISDRIENALTDANITLPRRGGPIVLSPQFTEPSLIYRLGKTVRLGDQVDFQNAGQLAQGTLLLLDKKNPTTKDYLANAIASATEKSLCWTYKKTVAGTNYSKGEDVEIDILQASSCPENPESENAEKETPTTL